MKTIRGEKMKKYIKPILTILLLQIIIGFIHLVIYNFGHPLTDLLSNVNIPLRVLGVSIFAFIIYFSVGYLFMIAVNKDRTKLKGLEIGLLFLMVIYLAFFLAMYLHFVIYERESIWITYMLLNPLFGTAMYGKMSLNNLNMLWVLSAFVPAIAMGLGIEVCINKGDK